MVKIHFYIFLQNSQSTLSENKRVNNYFEPLTSAKPFQMCLKTDGVESGPTGTAGMETHPATAGTTGFSISKWNYCEVND